MDYKKKSSRKRKGRYLDLLMMIEVEVLNHRKPRIARRHTSRHKCASKEVFRSCCVPAIDQSIYRFLKTSSWHHLSTSRDAPAYSLHIRIHLSTYDLQCHSKRNHHTPGCKSSPLLRDSRYDTGSPTPSWSTCHRVL